MQKLRIFPINDLMPILQEQLPGKTLSTELVCSDEKLLAGLQRHLYQMVVLHHCPEDKDLFCQRYLDEQLYISIFTPVFRATRSFCALRQKDEACPYGLAESRWLKEIVKCNN